MTNDKTERESLLALAELEKLYDPKAQMEIGRAHV